MPSKGKAGGRGSRRPEDTAPAGDDDAFAGDDIWPDDLPVRDINEDLNILDSDEAVATAPAETHSVLDPAPASAPESEDPVQARASDAPPQAEAVPEPDESAPPDLFDDRPAGPSEPLRRRAAPRRVGSRTKAETAVQLELWPGSQAAGQQNDE